MHIICQFYRCHHVTYTVIGKAIGFREGTHDSHIREFIQERTCRRNCYGGNKIDIRLVYDDQGFLWYSCYKFADIFNRLIGTCWIIRIANPHEACRFIYSFHESRKIILSRFKISWHLANLSTFHEAIQGIFREGWHAYYDGVTSSNQCFIDHGDDLIETYSDDELLRLYLPVVSEFHTQIGGVAIRIVVGIIMGYIAKNSLPYQWRCTVRIFIRRQAHQSLYTKALFHRFSRLLRYIRFQCANYLFHRLSFLSIP